MDKQKKQELAEKDSRWSFEKTIQVPTQQSDLDWGQVKDTFNMLQGEEGDLYMEVSKMPLPKTKDKIWMWYRQYQTQGTNVTFHHSQVYEWFKALAHYLNVSTGEAVHKVLYNREELRETLDLGDTVNVSVNSVSSMDTRQETEVSKDELKEMIEDE